MENVMSEQENKIKKFKATYSYTTTDGKIERKEKIVEARNDLEVQTDLCRDSFKEDERKMIKVLSINELDHLGEEIIRTGASGRDAF
jgi:hypothetical protein